MGVNDITGKGKVAVRIHKRSQTCCSVMKAIKTEIAERVGVGMATKKWCSDCYPWIPQWAIAGGFAWDLIGFQMQKEGFKVSHIIEQFFCWQYSSIKPTVVTAALESIIVRIRLLEFSYLFYSSKSNESGWRTRLCPQWREEPKLKAWKSLYSSCVLTVRPFLNGASSPVQKYGSGLWRRWHWWSAGFYDPTNFLQHNLLLYHG